MAPKNSLLSSVPQHPLQRRVDLLWGVDQKRSRTGLTVSAIVTRAVALADKKGISAVSMRTLAEYLGVGAMTLYSHITTKDDLIALMIDHALGDAYPTAADIPRREQADWRAAMALVAERNIALQIKHAWLASVFTHRNWLGPNAIRKYELELEPLDGIGLTDVEMDATLGLVLAHASAVARLEIGLRMLQAETGMSDAEWWEASAPALMRIMDATKFPLGIRVGQASSEAYQAAVSASHAHAFGLARILDGVTLMLASATASPP